MKTIPYLEMYNEFYKKWDSDDYDERTFKKVIIDTMHEAAKQAHNNAIEEAANNATTKIVVSTDAYGGSSLMVDKQSILKLKI